MRSSQANLTIYLGDPSEPPLKISLKLYFLLNGKYTVVMSYMSVNLAA